MHTIQTITRSRASKLECGIDKVFLRGNLAVEEGKLVKEKLGKYIARGKKQL